MAHGLHPNYASKHDTNHAPKLNGGFVIKHNPNIRYATSAPTATIFRLLGERVGCPVQEFAVRSDSGCGSTIGPILSTLCGIRTVDVGTAQWSMHSIREMMGAHDAETGYVHLKAVLKHFAEVDVNLHIDG
jgi:aspartyl aminopeptidase